jgi:hypothetical protein
MFMVFLGPPYRKTPKNVLKTKVKKKIYLGLVGFLKVNRRIRGCKFLLMASDVQWVDTHSAQCVSPGVQAQQPRDAASPGKIGSAARTKTQHVHGLRAAETKKKKRRT